MNFTQINNELSILDDNNKFYVGKTNLIDIFEMIENDELLLKNEYQRETNVWNDSEKKELFLSLKDGLPIPAIYIYPENDVLSVLDGIQRISTLYGFYKDPSSPEFKGEMTVDIFTELIKTVYIPLIIFKSDKNDYINLFEKINDTGSKVNNQELRRSKFQDSKIRKFIIDNAEEVSKFGGILKETGTFSEKQEIRQQIDEFILWLLIIEKNLANPIKDMPNTEKNNLDKIYNESEITNVEWKQMNETLSIIKDIILDVRLSDYKRRLNGKAYVFNLYLMIRNGSYFNGVTASEIADELLKAFTSMKDIEFDSNNNSRPFEIYKISRTTMSKDRIRSIEQLKSFL